MTDRVRDADFPLEESWRITENLAYVSADRDGRLFDEVQQLHRNLMNSPGHRANILDPNVDYVDIGLQVGDFDGTRVLMGTQNFAATKGALNLDIAAGITIGTVDRPFQGITSPADRLDANGPVTRNLTGTDANDRLVKGAADDALTGGAGNDLIAGGGGNDILTGGFGNDTLLGGGGRDQLKGEVGHDRLFGHMHNAPDRVETPSAINAGSFR